ncbi:MAG TPA: hypothetical protein VE133_17485, partial [Candidatus Sulfotelmatobacter sp.]|nr:hypothetical protein [Candidatus Sulfotelmatobacter sp.]
MNTKIKTHLKQERGIAMLVALLALVLLAAIGMGLMFMADTENSVNNNYRDSQKAYFAARAGAENVRLQLAGNGQLNATAMNLSMPDAVVGTGIIYALNPTGEAIDPTTAPGNILANNPYLDDQLCWEAYTKLNLSAGTGGPCGANGQTLTQLLQAPTSFTKVNLNAGPGVGGADALPFKWVRLTNKQNLMGTLSGKKVDPAQADGLQVCWDGSKEVVIPLGQSCGNQFPPTMPVWEVTSLAVTPNVGKNPGSRRMVQMEVSLNPALIPPAPISTQAPVNLQGSFILNAYDNCSCTCVSDGKTTSCGVGQPGCVKDAHAVYTTDTVSQTGGSGQTYTGYGSDPTGAAS